MRKSDPHAMAKINQKYIGSKFTNSGNVEEHSNLNISTTQGKPCDISITPSNIFIN